MSQVVAKRYADALFQLGQDTGSLDQFVEEAKVLTSVFAENDQLTAFLEHPKVSHEQKMQFIDEVFQEFSGDIVKTFKLLVMRHRTDVAPAVMDHLVHMVNDAEAVSEATVYSVRELSENEQAKIKNTFAERFNKRDVKLKTVVDPSILGGIKVQVGNTVYDGTVQGKLRRMERRIEAAN
ncbi:F0F1 ATP synthase subunit delta [Barrientosiimonas marina]|uniref:ATP synthase subunit delta n=1 Tax=Lentibacillus kimchii TaxID=1542911 RepID=A0ABW2UVF9_9BACI